MSKFEQLPNEILFKIFDYNSLSAKDLISLSNVCERFDRFCCSEEKLWKCKFETKWPLAWKKINFGSAKSSWVENWKKAVEDSVMISKKLEEILNSLSRHLFTHYAVTFPILFPIFQLINVGALGPLIVFNDLLLIINGKSATDLTIRYYAKEVLPQVNCYFWSEKLRKFLALPPENQSLEKAIFYLRKYLYPEEFFGMDYKELSSKFDQLAYEVQLHLRTKNPTHPTASIKLLSPDEPLKNSLWSDEICSEVHECINYILFDKHNHRRFGNTEEVFSNNISRLILGYDRYVSVTFKAICHRLGILLNLIVHDDDGFLFEWKSNLEILEVTDPFHRSRLPLNNLREEEKNQIRQKKCTIRKLLISLASENFVWGDGEIIPESIGAVAMILEIHSLPEDYCELVTGQIVEFCLDEHLHLEVVIEICEKLLQTSSIVKEEKVKIRNFSARAEKLLAIQQKGPEPINPRKRIKGVDMKFATGMIVYHSWYKIPGVIIGWDEKKYFESSPVLFFVAYISNSFDYDKNQPHYYVLLSNGAIFYEPQEYLYLLRETPPIQDDRVGKYFKAFDGKFYVPNEEFHSQYPDDEKVIKELISNYNYS